MYNALALLGLIAVATAMVPLETHTHHVQNSYILLLKPGVALPGTPERAQLLEKLNSTQVYGEIEEWDFIHAIHAHLDEKLLNWYREYLGDWLELIEEDEIVEANPSCSVTASSVSAAWGIRRVTTPGCTTSFTTFKTPAQEGQGTFNYVLDTGIKCTHQEFGGRAIAGASMISGESACQDFQGHGTHVAGTVGGATVGIARKSTLVDVKVLSKTGSGSNSGVISGVEWAMNDAIKRGAHCSGSKGCKSTINMSLGGGSSSALDKAVNAAMDKGVIVVVAAGNENRDACGGSPARANRIITVGSTTNKNARSSFSNYGSCTDVFAPGSSIYSAGISSNSAYSTLSGTSMASPHVAGVMATWISANVVTSASGAKSALVSNAIDGCVSDAKGTANKIAYLC